MKKVPLIFIHMARYKLSNPHKKQLAITYFNRLIEAEKNIELRELKPIRSLNQNSLYWLWLTVLQVENGISKDHAHLLYRGLFLQKDENKIIKIIYPGLWEKIKSKLQSFYYFEGLPDVINLISYSTTELDTKQYTNYLNKIQDHALEKMGISLITLDDKMFNDFYNEYITFQK